MKAKQKLVPVLTGKHGGLILLLPCKSNADAQDMLNRLDTGDLLSYALPQTPCAHSEPETVSNEVLAIYGVIDFAEGHTSWTDNRKRYYLCLELDHDPNQDYNLYVKEQVDLDLLYKLVK